MKNPVSIAQFQHRVALCSQNDVVEENGTLVLNREEVLKTWAHIKTSQGSMFSRQGAAMMESDQRRTHKIFIRYSTKYNVSAYAWLYEARLKSPPRWFKILRVDQTETSGQIPVYEFDVRLVERGDDIPTPAVQGGPARVSDIDLYGD